MSDDLLLQEMARDIRELRGEMREVRDTLAERRGERKVTGWAIGGVSGMVGSLLVNILTKMYLARHT